MKCDEVQDADDGHQSCKSCREVGQVCEFNAPVRKRPVGSAHGEQKWVAHILCRGPAVGFKKRRRTVSSVEHGRRSGASPTDTVGPMPSAQPSSPPPTIGRATNVNTTATTRIPSPESLRSRSTSRAPTRDLPLLGLPRSMIDELLVVYFTHVHVSPEPLRPCPVGCIPARLIWLIECLASDI